MSSPLSLGPGDTLSVIVSVTEDGESKRPHQAFLTLHEPATGLEESYVIAVKESGKGKVEVVSLIGEVMSEEQMLSQPRHTRTCQTSFSHPSNLSRPPWSLALSAPPHPLTPSVSMSTSSATLQ